MHYVRTKEKLRENKMRILTSKEIANSIQIPRPPTIFDMLPKTVEDIVTDQTRFKDEDFVNYKKRIALEQKVVKIWLRGRMFHDSSKLGTYRKI